jgi:hypothetical protein
MGKWYEVVEENGQSVFKCKLCGFTVSNSKSNMSIMNEHLDKVHPDRNKVEDMINTNTNEEVEEEDMEEPENDDIDNTDNTMNDDNINVEYDDDISNNVNINNDNTLNNNFNKKRQLTPEEHIKLGGQEAYNEELIKVIVNAIREVAQVLPKGDLQAMIDTNIIKDYLSVYSDVLNSAERLGYVLTNEFKYKPEIVSRVLLKFATYKKKYSMILEQSTLNINVNHIDNRLNSNSYDDDNNFNPYSADSSMFDNNDNYYRRKMKNRDMRQEYNPYDLYRPPTPPSYIRPYYDNYGNDRYNNNSREEINQLKREIEELKALIVSGSGMQQQKSPYEDFKNMFEIFKSLMDSKNGNGTDNQLSQEIKEMKDKYEQMIREQHESQIKVYEDRIKRLEDLTKNINENNAKMIMKLSDTYKEQIEGLRRSLGNGGSKTPGDVAITSIDRKYDAMEKTLDRATQIADNYMKYKMKVPDGYKLEDEHNDDDYKKLQEEVILTDGNSDTLQNDNKVDNTNNNTN